MTHHATHLVLLFALALAGCGYQATGNEPSAANIDQLRRTLLLAEEPSDVLGVLDAQESLPADADAAIVGKIGGVPSPLTVGEASFVIADPAVLADGETHDCEKAGCHFCKKNERDPSHGLAVVRFVDEQGRPQRFDAQEVFDLQADQTVVVRGRCQRDAKGMLVVTATGLYVRR